MLALVLTLAVAQADYGYVEEQPPDPGPMHFAVAPDGGYVRLSPAAPPLPPSAVDAGPPATQTYGEPPPPAVPSVTPAPAPEAQAAALLLDGGPGDGGLVDPASRVVFRGAVEADLGVLPSGLPENGLDVFTSLKPVAGFSVGDDFELTFGPTFRFRVIDTPGLNRAGDPGSVLRGADWDEVADFGQLIQSLRIASESGPFFIRLGPVRKKSLGLGHLVSRYSNQENVDYHPTSARAVLALGPLRGEFFASDLLGPRLYSAEVAWDLGRTFSSAAEVRDRYLLSLQFAHDASRSGLPFRLDKSVTAVRPPEVTLIHLDASAVLVRNASLKWLVMVGTGVRANAAADLGFLVGTALDASSGDLGFSTRLELRKQAGGFRHGFFGPAYELQRYADTGFSGPGLATAVLPDGASGYAELRVGLGTRFSLDATAEYFFWNRLDLDTGFQLVLLDEWLTATARFTALGLAQTPRFSVNAGLRVRFFPSFYGVAQAGTVFMPQPDGTLIRGVMATAGVGLDFEK